MTNTRRWHASRQDRLEGLRKADGADQEASDPMIATRVRHWSSQGIGSSSSSRDGRFLAVSALLFTASAVITIVSCASMSRMGEMPIAGGWMMSMVWTRMPHQTWLGATASFLGLWIEMMVAMMLPSLVPTLRHYRHAVAIPGEKHIDWLTALAGAGYFFIWIVAGMIAFGLGGAVTSFVMERPALGRTVPIAAGVTVVIAGLLQFTEWKARCLGCCRGIHGRHRTLTNDAGTAWQDGMRLGLDCAACCANLMAILLVIGVMDLRAMAAITTAITVERLAPNLRLQTSRRAGHGGEIVAQAIGVVVVAAGVLLLARATTLI
jgi:predicted metal-binding membrane protein